MNEKAAHDSIHQDTDRTSIVVTRRVRPGCEAAYEALLNGLLEDAKRFPGFQGAQVLRPTSPDRLKYQITLHFENRQAQERWVGSKGRRRWVEKIDALEGTSGITMLAGLEAWLSLSAESRTNKAPRYKTAFVIWTAVFPTVFVVSTLLSWLPFAMPLLLSVFVITAITVPTSIYILIPRLYRLFNRWMYHESKIKRLENSFLSAFPPSRTL